MDQRADKELFSKIMEAGKGKKAHKDEPALYFFVSPQKVTSIDEGSFVVERWLWED